jgi:hypothetical protein
MNVASMTAMAMIQGFVSGRETVTAPMVSALVANCFYLEEICKTLAQRAGCTPCGSASYTARLRFDLDAGVGGEEFRNMVLIAI